jgi:hypothetical protein
MYADEDERDYFGSGIPRGNKPAGFVGLMIAKKHLGRTPESYDPTAHEKSTPELFDMDLIRQPSKYIQENLYAESTRIRTGIQKIKDITAKARRAQVVRKFVHTYKERPPVGQMTAEAMTDAEMKRFAESYHRAGIEGVVYEPHSFTGNIIFLHLIRKYKNDCVIAVKSIWNVYFPGLTITKDYKRVYAYEETEKEIADTMKDCVDAGKSIIALPFLLPSHQNILLYRPAANTIERYEPHGEESPATKEQNASMDKAIKAFFLKKAFNPILRRKGVPPFKYLRPVDFGYKEGFQTFDNIEARRALKRGDLKVSYRGFCMMWSYFYLELALKFPNLTGKEVVDKAFEAINTKKGGDNFLRTILAYVEDFQKVLGRIFPGFSYHDLDDPAKRKLVEDYINKEFAKEMTEQKNRMTARQGGILSSCCPPNSRECNVEGGYYGGFMKGLEYVSLHY